MDSFADIRVNKAVKFACWNFLLFLSSKTIKIPAGKCDSYIQLFLERLSEKVHATIPKGIVGGFKFAFPQRNLKEWHERAWIYVCEC